MLFRAYQADYLATQGGKVGITLNVNWGEPQDAANPEHVEASERFMDFFLGWYAHPIFVSGQYPEVIYLFSLQNILSIYTDKFLDHEEQD